MSNPEHVTGSSECDVQALVFRDCTSRGQWLGVTKDFF